MHLALLIGSVLIGFALAPGARAADALQTIRSPKRAVPVAPNDRETIQKVKGLLESPYVRTSLIEEGGPKAQAQARAAQELAGSPENLEALYDLAADVFQTLMAKTGGDVDKALALLKQAERDPQGLSKTLGLTSEQTRKIRTLAATIARTGGKTPRQP